MSGEKAPWGKELGIAAFLTAALNAWLFSELTRAGVPVATILRSLTMASGWTVPVGSFAGFWASTHALWHAHAAIVALNRENAKSKK